MMCLQGSTHTQVLLPKVKSTVGSKRDTEISGFQQVFWVHLKGFQVVSCLQLNDRELVVHLLSFYALKS